MASTDRKYLISEEELYHFVYCENALYALRDVIGRPPLKGIIYQYEELYAIEHPGIHDFSPLGHHPLSEIAVYEVRNEFQPYTRNQGKGVC